MCGSVNVSDHEGVRVLLGMDIGPTRDPRYNISPMQTLDVVRLHGENLELVPMHWGVSLTLPGKSGKMITKLIQNARSDKVWEARIWKTLIAEQRVLVQANGFYEWQCKNKKLEAAYYITPAGKLAMLLAGICRQPKDESENSQVSIVTTSANDAMSKVHDRLPLCQCH